MFSRMNAMALLLAPLLADPRSGRRTRLGLDATWAWAQTLALGFTRLRAAFT